MEIWFKLQRAEDKRMGASAHASPGILVDEPWHVGSRALRPKGDRLEGFGKETRR
jgi:hypothetical protein